MIQPRSEGRVELPAGPGQAEALGELLSRARHEVRIFSDQLDPQIFDHEGIAGELSRVARQGRQCEVRILIKDSSLLVKRSHRLAALHHRIPSSVQLRRLGHFPEHYIVNYVLVDDCGVFLIPNGDDKVCFMNHEDRALVRNCTEQFDELWQKSIPDPELRVMPM